jgi:hypothetical protein
MRLFGAEQSHRSAIRKHRSNARFLKSIDSCVGVLRRIDDVAPIEKSRYPRIDLIERPDEITCVRIPRRVELNNSPNENAKILIKRPIRSNTAQRGLPKMDMPIDEARHCNHATAIKFSNGPTSYITADSNDFVIVASRPT